MLLLSFLDSLYKFHILIRVYLDFVSRAEDVLSSTLLMFRHHRFCVTFLSGTKLKRMRKMR